jgi:hypothetical protein
MRINKTKYINGIRVSISGGPLCENDARILRKKPGEYEFVIEVRGNLPRDAYFRGAIIDGKVVEPVYTADRQRTDGVFNSLDFLSDFELMRTEQDLIYLIEDWQGEDLSRVSEWEWLQEYE